MLTGIITAMTAKWAWSAIVLEGFKEIPWKWVGIGLAVLGVVLTLTFGYLHVQRLQDRLLDNVAELARERLTSGLERAKAEAIKNMHDTATRQLQELENARSQIEQEASDLRKSIEDTKVQEITHDDPATADAALARLNSRSRELNRLQRVQSKANVRPRAPAAR